MIYSILIYGAEDAFSELRIEEQTEVLARHAAIRRELASTERLGPVMRLTPGDARTIRRYKDRSYITDGPFAETKEQLMGLYVIECGSIDEAFAAADRLGFEDSILEIREVTSLDPGLLPRKMPPE